MNDTTRRFLNAIVDKIPSGGEIIELRLFPAIRQGGMESGVAVVAVETPAPGASAVDADVVAPALIDDIAVVDAVVDALDVELVALSDVTTLDDDDTSPYADDSADETTIEGELDTPKSVTAPFKRYAMLTARYRLVLKGPDRGKWEMEVTHEADAPLATLERVARGVAKRAGEETDPEHFSAQSLRRALDAPAWVTTT